MLTIKDILGKDLDKIILQDDDSLEGGISHPGETLQEFLLETDLDIDTDSISSLQLELKSCGIKQIEQADLKVQELIEQKMWDIEEELGIDIISWSWDYKNFNY